MALKSSNKVDVNRYELVIEIDKEKFQNEINDVYKKERKNINIPGFRKGKAPKHFIEKLYGEKVFYDKAINNIYPEELENAIKESGLEFVDDTIDFDIIRADKDGLEFKVKITVKPDVKLGEYKGIEIKVNPSDVSEDDINDEIDRLRERNARIVSVEGKSAEEGNVVVIDFEGFLDGVPFEGGSAENYTLKLGSKQFIPGFEEQIIGHNTDDEFDIMVTFPEDYQAKNLAGKEAVFKIKLHEIKVLELPDLDDDFVKDISEFDTLDEYKEDLKAKLQEKKEQEAKADCDDQIICELIKQMEVEVPEAMYRNRIDFELRKFVKKIEEQGVSFEDYKKILGVTEEKIKEQFREGAEKNVKGALALEKVIELEGISANDAEIEDEFSKIASDIGIDADKVKKFVLREEVVKDIKFRKALDLIFENAIILE